MYYILYDKTDGQVVEITTSIDVAPPPEIDFIYSSQPDVDGKKIVNGEIVDDLDYNIE